jgi:hypothetical protein
VPRPPQTEDLVVNNQNERQRTEGDNKLTPLTSATFDRTVEVVRSSDCLAASEQGNAVATNETISLPYSTQARTAIRAQRGVMLEESRRTDDSKVQTLVVLLRKLLVGDVYRGISSEECMRTTYIVFNSANHVKRKGYREVIGIVEEYVQGATQQVTLCHHNVRSLDDGSSFEFVVSELCACLKNTWEEISFRLSLISDMTMHMRYYRESENLPGPYEIGIVAFQQHLSRDSGLDISTDWMQYGHKSQDNPKLQTALRECMDIFVLLREITNQPNSYAPARWLSTDANDPNFAQPREEMKTFERFALPGPS